MERRTLRIKKVYFDAIKNGEKKYEYRTLKPYYERLFAGLKTPFLLNLHYQGTESLTVYIDEIKICRRPKSVDPLIIPTARCYRLRVQAAWVAK